MAGNNGSATGEVVRAVHRSFKTYFMRRNKHWNRIGPPLPLWFKLAVKAVDSRLVFQYIPPNTIDINGLDYARFPHGAWYICGKLRRSKEWITKRAMYLMVDEHGKPSMPTYKLVKLLRLARLERKKQGVNRLQTVFEQSLAKLGNEKSKRSKDELMQNIINTMRKLGMTSSAKPRVFIPAPAGG